MFKHNRTLSAIFAVFFALSVMSGGAMAAAPTIDTSTTDDTATTTELQQDSTISNFTANDSQATTVQYVADSNESRVDISHNATGDLVYQNGTPATVNWNSTSGEGNFNVSVNHGELADLERGINDNVSIEVLVHNNTNISSPDNTSFTAFVETDDSYSVEYVSSSDVDSDMVDLSEGRSLSVAGANISMPSLIDSDNSDLSTTRNVTENTTVVLALGDSNVSEDFTDATEDTNPLPGGGSAESGDRMWSVTATVDGEAVPVYYEQAPDSVGDNETYAVFTEDHGGSQAVLVENHGSTDSVDVSMVGSANLPQVISAYGGEMFNPLNIIPTDLLSNLTMDMQAPRFVGA